MIKGVANSFQYMLANVVRWSCGRWADEGDVNFISFRFRNQCDILTKRNVTRFLYKM